MDIILYLDLLNDDIMELLFILLKDNFRGLSSISDRYKLLLQNFNNKIELGLFNPTLYFRYNFITKKKLKDLLINMTEYYDLIKISDQLISNDNYTTINELIDPLEDVVTVFLNINQHMLIKSGHTYIIYTQSVDNFLDTCHYYYLFDNLGDFWNCKRGPFDTIRYFILEYNNLHSLIDISLQKYYLHYFK